MIVAIAFLMEQLDATIVTTAIPAMARSLQVSALSLSLAVSAYVLTLAVFIPVSGWLADRFGARRVFIVALALFTLGSALCGLAPNFALLIAARVLQGLGGAMMTPVGRLILLRSFARSQLVRAMTYATLPAIIGPVLGPLLGGWITTDYSWRWIFFINLPIGLLGIVLASRHVAMLGAEAVPRFDARGFVLFALAVALLQGAMEGVGHLSPLWLALAAALGAVGLLVYAVWRHGHGHPAVDLTLLRERAFAIATLAGGLCRVALNAPVYLLPLLLQLGLGWSAAASGSITFLSAIGSPFIRLIVGPLLRRLGFRAVLLASAVASALVLLQFAAVQPTTPTAVIAGMVVIYGLVRSTAFMTSNTLAYADVAAERLSRATSLGGLLQQLTVSFGVSLAAALLAVLAGRQSRPGLPDFHAAFMALAALPLLALPAFARLQPQDGAVVSGHRPTAPQS